MRTLPPELVHLAGNEDERGVLHVIEAPQLPFTVQRLCIVTADQSQRERGGHGHYRCDQLLIAVHGAIEVSLNPSNAPQTFTLTPHGEGLLIPAGNWARQTYLSEGSTLLVLASTTYDPEDYFTDEGTAPL